MRAARGAISTEEGRAREERRLGRDRRLTGWLRVGFHGAFLTLTAAVRARKKVNIVAIEVALDYEGAGRGRMLQPARLCEVQSNMYLLYRERKSQHTAGPVTTLSRSVRRGLLSGSTGVPGKLRERELAE